MTEALTKAVSRTAIISAIGEMRDHPKSSPQYHSAYGYVSLLEREATEALLELLAEEKDRSVRFFYLDLIRDLGKNQITLLGEHLTDSRWYHVRNIVSILAESKAEQVIPLLRKVADHKNIRIRQEVVRGLPLIGGKKAAGVLAKFLGDKEVDVRLMAIRAFVGFPGVGAEEANPLIEFLKGCPIKRNELEQTLEAIKSLGTRPGRGISTDLYAHPVVETAEAPERAPPSGSAGYRGNPEEKGRCRTNGVIAGERRGNPFSLSSS
jgi:hypothetical protein